MRHVFPTSEVFHLWAHQTQSDARNGARNVFFEGPTIYSYRRTWPLARIYTKKRAPKGALTHPNVLLNATQQAQARDEGIMVLTNSTRYSVTTAKHQSHANRAVSHLPSIAVPCVDNMHTYHPMHATNLEHFQKESARLLAEAKRVLSSNACRWRLESAQTLHLAAGNYSKFFGIRRKVPDFPVAEWQAALDRAQRIETPDPVRDAAKIRARAKAAERFDAQVADYRAKLAAHQAQDAEAWRLGGHMTSPEWWRAMPRKMRVALTGRRGGLAGSPDAVACMLRVNGDQIETSQGARIPLDHAPRIWRLVQACREVGRPYARPEQRSFSEHAGTYAIDSISAEGDLKVGCHNIPYAELERMARTLGFEVQS
jgi:hypothetical protein